MFPEEEEKIAEAALSSFEQAKSSRAGRSVLSLAAPLERHSSEYFSWISVESGAWQEVGREAVQEARAHRP